MKTARIVLALLIALLLFITLLPSGFAQAEEPPISYGLGLIPSEGDLPMLDTSRLMASPQALPTRVDLSAGLPPVGSQGNQGSCVGWALAYYYKTFQEGVERQWSLNTTAHQFSPAWIYNQRATANCTRDGGMSYYNGLTILKTKGAATLASFPYSVSDTCRQPSQAVKDEAYPYRVDDFSALFSSRGTANLSAMKGLLAAGTPIAIAVPVYTSFTRVTYDRPIVPRHTEGETFYGGHAMLIVGYDDSVGGFLTVNSWGRSWGRNGYCYLAYSFVQYDAWEAWVMADHIDSPRMPADRFNNPTKWISQFGRQAGGWSSLNQLPRMLGDVNGDGKADVVAFAALGVYVSLSQDSGFAEPVLWLNSFGTQAGGWTNQNIYPRLLGDVNGDGKADIIAFGTKATLVALSNGSSFGRPTAWAQTFCVKAGGWTNQNTYPRLVGDVNGDGKADIIAFGTKATLVALSNGSSFGRPVVWLNNYYPRAGWISQDVMPRLIGDVNGDGKADVVAFGRSATLVSLSTGARFADPVVWITNFCVDAGGWTNQNEHPRMLADVNHDGRADIVGFGEDATYVSLSNGSGFEPPVSWLDDFGSEMSGWSCQELYPRWAADVSGDGNADIVGFGNDGTYAALAASESVAIPAMLIREPHPGDMIVPSDDASTETNADVHNHEEPAAPVASATSGKDQPAGR